MKRASLKKQTNKQKQKQKTNKQTKLHLRSETVVFSISRHHNINVWLHESGSRWDTYLLTSCEQCLYAMTFKSQGVVNKDKNLKVVQFFHYIMHWNSYRLWLFAFHYYKYTVSVVKHYKYTVNVVKHGRAHTYKYITQLTWISRLTVFCETKRNETDF